MIDTGGIAVMAAVGIATILIASLAIPPLVAVGAYWLIEPRLGTDWSLLAVWGYAQLGWGILAVVFVAFMNMVFR